MTGGEEEENEEDGEDGEDGEDDEDDVPQLERGIRQRGRRKPAGTTA